MVGLPEDFRDRMRAQLGDEAEAFFASYEQEGFAGLRVNMGKVSVEEFLSLTPFHLTPIPWTENGFYYEKDEPVTRHPHYHGGLYYVQEPSAMLPAARLPVKPGDTVLDLCAAPGGKATELASLLGGSGLLVANDASASRAKALVKNLTVWGGANCCVTAETPERLLQSFGCFFDKILVDAPCSGEGMFRKDPGLIRSWEERGPQTYCEVQKEILDCAALMLKPGGTLAYSTCTFSLSEDEEVILEILNRYPELTLIQPETVPGFAPGDPPCEKAVRLWPHRIKGEGHFLALIKKADCADGSRREAENGFAENKTEGNRTGAGKEKIYARREAERKKRGESEIRKSQEQMPDEVREFLEQIPERLWKNCMYRQIGEQCLLTPPYKLPEELRYLRTGLLAGTWKKGRFEPSQALAMTLDAGSFPHVLNLTQDDGRAIRYLKGETLELTESELAETAAERGVQFRETAAERGARFRETAKKGSECAGIPVMRETYSEKTALKNRKRSGAAIKGWVLVCVDGFGLGWGKLVNGSLRNKYYPGWRLQ